MIVANPGLELVGCYAWSGAKVGVDVGEVAGIDPVDVAATDDVDALLGLQPECVVDNPMWPSVDELVRILEAGVNAVDTTFYEDFMAIGHIITAVPALNAIPAVVAAPPAIVTCADPSFPMPRGWVPQPG